jgi:hypothetical protein
MKKKKTSWIDDANVAWGKSGRRSVGEYDAKAAGWWYTNGVSERLEVSLRNRRKRGVGDRLMAKITSSEGPALEADFAADTKLSKEGYPTSTGEVGWEREKILAPLVTWKYLKNRKFKVLTCEKNDEPQVKEPEKPSRETNLELKDTSVAWGRHDWPRLVPAGFNPERRFEVGLW